MDSNLRSPTDPLPYSGTQVLLPFGVSSLCRRRRTGRRSAFRLRKSRSARDRRAPWSLAAGGGSGNGGSGCWAPRRLRSTMMPLWLLVWRGLPCWISGLTSVKWLTPIGGLLAPFRPPPSLVQSRSLVFLGDLVHAGWTGASTKPVFWVGHHSVLPCSSSLKYRPQLGQRSKKNGRWLLRGGSSRRSLGPYCCVAT